MRVDLLAKTLGVTRGGFYHQFDSRAGFLDELLDTWERRSTDEVLERVEREGGDASAKVRKAGMLTFSNDLLPIDLAVRDWARRDTSVADGCGASTTAGWTTCVRSSARSATTPRTSKPAACSPSRWPSATISSPPTTPASSRAQVLERATGAY